MVNTSAAGRGRDRGTEAASRDNQAVFAYLRHELRTPLNTIVGLGKILLDEAVDSDEQETASGIRSIYEGGHRLLKTVEDALIAAESGEGLTEKHLKAFGVELRKGVLASISTIIMAVTDLSKNRGETDKSYGDLRDVLEAARDFLAFVNSLVLKYGSVWEAVQGGRDRPESAELAREAVESMRSAAHSVPEKVKSTGGSVLIVDDGRMNRQVLTKHLVKMGHRVTEAEDGRQALALVEKGNFDAILLDIMMPVMNGFQALELLKADERFRDIPVVMISALDEMSSVVRCIEMGADDFLAKPFNPDILNARLTACLDKKRMRDKEKDYLANAVLVTEAAASVEAGTFDPESLAHVAERDDALGRLARVFQGMAREVYTRELALRAKVRELHIELNETRQATQVAEITESEYFMKLQDKAKDLRLLLDRDEDGSAGEEPTK